RGPRILEDPPISMPSNSKTTPRPGRSWRCSVETERLLLLGSFVGRARAGRTDEQLLAVRERDVAPVGPIRTVLGLEAFDEDLSALGERGLVPTTAEQRVWRAAFDHPPFHLPSGRVLHVDVNPGMRVDPFHLHDRAPQLDRTLGVEFSRKGVVC